MQEISFELYARLNLKYALLTPSICVWILVTIGPVVSKELIWECGQMKMEDSGQRSLQSFKTSQEPAAQVS